MNGTGVLSRWWVKEAGFRPSVYANWPYLKECKLSPIFIAGCSFIILSEATTHVRLLPPLTEN